MTQSTAEIVEQEKPETKGLTICKIALVRLNACQVIVLAEL